jgi:hypothetical protein
MAWLRCTLFHRADWLEYPTYHGSYLHCFTCGRTWE